MMSDAAPKNLPRSALHRERTLRPRPLAHSLNSQLGHLGATLVDESPLEFIALCFVFLGVFSSLSTLYAAVGLAIFAILLYVRGLSGAWALLLWSPLLAYPLLQVVSTFWSPDPQITARYSVQLFMTMLIGLYVGVFRSQRDAIRLYFVTSATLLIASIVSGRQGASAEGAVLVGVLGSKDALALTAQAACQMGIALVLMRGQWFWRVAGLSMVPIGIYLVMRSNAAEGVVTLAIGILLAGALRVSSVLKRRAKAALFFSVIVVVAAGSIMHSELVKLAQDFAFNVLHKDSTLTGRTILWDHASEFIRQRPWLGWGYKEAWIGSSSDTTGLLRWAGILDGRTFYFHNTWLEAAVDSGYLGAAVLACTWFAIFLSLSLSLLTDRTSPPLECFFVMMVLLSIRSFGETIMQPFFDQVALISTMGVVGYRYMRSALQPAE